MYLSRFDEYGVAAYREGTEPMYSSGVIGVINSIVLRLSVTECLCHTLIHDHGFTSILFVIVTIPSSMFFHDRILNKRHTTVATIGIGTAYPSGEHMFALGFYWRSFC